MRVRIVLVEPLEAGNVGAAARAMKNFGYTDLWIVGSKRERVDDVSAWWAVGAIDVVENATRVDTLEARNRVAKAEMAKGSADRLKAEAEQFQRDLEIMRQLVPTGNEVPALLEQVSTAARRVGLDLSNVEPQPVIEGEQLYCTARRGHDVSLTPRGKEYWGLAKRGRV